MNDIINYLSDPGNRTALVIALREHIYLSLVPLVIAVLLAIALGAVGYRNKWVAGVLIGTANVVYTIPSLALFALIPALIGTQVLNPLNVIIALSIYTTALLVRPVIDALGAVAGHISAAAVAMGFRPTRRFFAVELPLSVPVLLAGVRVGAVSNISLVSVGALIGVGGLGTLFTDGFRQRYLAPIIIGVVLTLLLALIVDLLLVAIRRVLTPWTRAERP